MDKKHTLLLTCAFEIFLKSLVCWEEKAELRIFVVGGGGVKRDYL